MIARFLDRLADTHPRTAMALVFAGIVGFGVLVAAVCTLFLYAASLFIFFAGA